jgi:hypothetical protein
MTGISQVWKGGIIGALIGCVMLVFSGPFKGNLAEPEFLAQYIGYLIPATAIGAFVDWRRHRRQAPEQLPRKSRAFVIALVLLSLAVVVKVATDFPNGEGLFHPTHAANVAEAEKICLQKVAATTTPSQEAAQTYCSCWAKQIAYAAETGSAAPPLALARSADAACRQ